MFLESNSLCFRDAESNARKKFGKNSSLVWKPWGKRKRTPRKRPAMPTDFSKRLPGLEAREGRRGTCGAAESRESRSVSPEKGTTRQHEDHRGGSGSSGGSAGSECGRPDSRLGRRSPGSSPEPEDNSSTSGDEGTFPCCSHAYWIFYGWPDPSAYPAGL